MPIVEQKDGQVITITGNVIQMMDMKDFQTIEIPTDADKLAGMERFRKEIMYIDPMGKRKLDIE